MDATFTAKRKKVNNWENIFKKEGKFFLHPRPEMPAIVKWLKQRKVTKVLDLGCGTGRHLIYLAQRNFDVYGLDESKTALKLSRAWLRQKQLLAHLKVGNLHKKFPYKNNFFDAIISTQVIHHGTTKQVKKTISEMRRVLQLDGVIFITVAKRLFIGDKIIYKSKEIEPHVYVPLEGPEKGLAHFLFNKKLIRDLFCDFKILEVSVDSDNKNYCFRGVKK